MSPPRVLWRPQLPRGQELTRGYIIRWHGVKSRGTFSDTWKSCGAETRDDTCVAAVTGHVTREDVSAQQPHAPGLPAVAQQPPQLQEADDQQARLPGPQWWAGASCFLNVSTKIGWELSDCLMSIQCAVYQVFLNVLNLCGGYTDGRWIPSLKSSRLTSSYFFCFEWGYDFTCECV